MTDGIGRDPLALAIVPLADLGRELDRLVAAYGLDRAAIGAGTNAGRVVEAVAARGLPYALVDERETTLLARGRYFDDHPPRGWRRFVPRGMLLPERPIDDYAALLIAERFLSSAA